MKQWNQMLAETAHNAGVITNEEFAIFQNAGYIGLYGGLEKLRKDKVQGAEKATLVHYNVGKEVRNAIEKKGKLMLDE